MSDVIDIIHRLSYEVHDEALHRASSSISSQIREIERLQNEVKQLGQQYAQTSASDVQGRERIIRQISQHRATINQLNAGLRDNILNNRELQQALQRESGIIGALNTRLELLRRRRDEATDTASIRQFNREIAQTSRQLAGLSDSNAGSESGLSAGLGSLKGVAALAGVTLGADAILEFGKKVVDVTAKYEKFRSLLTNTLGSKGAAASVFQMVSDYASQTSYGVGEITEAFIKLANRGFNPTKNQLRQIGDLAASQGKSFDQLVEAILDAEGGEFERLKEFGVKTRQANDKVTFSFKDQTVTVDKNTTAIRGAILALGDLNGVAGSTAAVSATLEGKMSNLSDAWDKFMDTLGKRVAPAFSAALQHLTNFIDDTEKGLDSIGGKSLDVMVRENENVQKLLETFSHSGLEKRTKLIQTLNNQLQSFVNIEAQQLIPLEARQQVLSDKIKNSFLGDADATAEYKKNEAEISSLQKVRTNRKIYEELIKQLEDQNKLIKDDSKDNTGTTKVIENVYEQKLHEFNARLAAISLANYQSEENIRAKISEDVKKEQTEIAKLFKDGKLTAPQKDSLNALSVKIGNAEVLKQLEEFKKRRLDIQKRIDDELYSMALEDSEQHFQLLQNDFDRQFLLIDNEYEKQYDKLKKAKATLLQENTDGSKSGLIDKEVAESNASEIERIYTDLFNNLIIATNKKRSQLALSLFDEASRYDKTFFAGETAEEAERVEAEVKKLSSSYLSGEISYKKYQQDLTLILNSETANRRTLNIRELENELDLQERKFTAAKATASDSELNAIEERINNLRAQIAALNTEASKAEVSDKKGKDDKYSSNLNSRIKLFTELQNAGIQAYQAIAEAEENQVSRSIENQQRRIDRAQQIADRGNAKALQAEVERMNTLEKERERYARTQLAINAAQTVSSSILAIATAAGESGAGAIVIVPAVIAALAAGFAAVKSLTSEPAGYYKGVVGLEGPGTTTSDSIPARLSKGESVVTATGTLGHEEILKGMNKGKRYRLVDPDQVQGYMQLSSISNIIPNSMTAELAPKQAENVSSFRELIKEVRGLRNEIASRPASSWSMDRRGFIAMYQDEIKFQDKMKKL